jgi:hypothetical protein
LIAAGAMAVFIRVTLLSPMAVQRVTRVVGWPLVGTIEESVHTDYIITTQLQDVEFPTSLASDLQ